MKLTSALSTGLVLCALLCPTSGSKAAPGAIDRGIELGQEAFDIGNYVKAERFWKRALSSLEKAKPNDERTASVSQKLGESYFRQGKFSLAESAYKKSIDILKGLSLDTANALDKMKELSATYRSIDLLSFDETATNFAKLVGAKSASALKQEDAHHIDINLDKRFQQKLKDLLESFVPKKDNAAEQTEIALPSADGAPPVKQLRLDKKIAFDLKHGDNGNLRLANVQGIFFDVGLWVKLKDLLMFKDETNNPAVEVTAGAFGVEKKVKTSLPSNIFERLQKGLDKFDPFSTAGGAEKSEANAGQMVTGSDNSGTNGSGSAEKNNAAETNAGGSLIVPAESSNSQEKPSQ